MSFLRKLFKMKNAGIDDADDGYIYTAWEQITRMKYYFHKRGYARFAHNLSVIETALKSFYERPWSHPNLNAHNLHPDYLQNSLDLQFKEINTKFNKINEQLQTLTREQNNE